ncbi:hypothetical protein ABPG72_002056 [Tetrahymena utriculariae]
MYNIDIFGSQILFYFQKEKKYKTNLGGFITLAIITIIIIRSSVICFDAYNRVDPSIYTISITQYTQTTVKDPNTGQIVSNLTQRQIKSGICNSQNFQNPSTQKNFESIDYQNLYCIDPDEEIVIEGDNGKLSFSYAVITVSQCVSGCKSNDTLDHYLKNGFFSMYYTDITVDPIIQDNPFVHFNRDLFWTTSSKSPQVSSMYFRNNYVESDFGWISSDIQTVRYPQYSTQDIRPTQSSDYFFQIVLRFEKSKENKYQRKYQRLCYVASYIGGFCNTLITFGFILCSYLSEISFNNQIINEIFNIRINNKSKHQQQYNNDQFIDPTQQKYITNKDQKQIKLNNVLPFSENIQICENQDSQLDHTKLDQESIFKESQTADVYEKNGKVKKLVQLKNQYTQNQIKLSQILQKRTKNNFNVANGQEENIKQSENTSTQDNYEDAIVFENQVKEMLNEETNCTQISFFEQLKLHFWPFNKETRLKKIINQNLFGYLPKPYIQEDKEVQNKDQNKDKYNDNNFKDALYQDTRSESQKLQDAYENIDQNLINIFKIARENSLQESEENYKIVFQNE